jgi:hypothetical protein
MTYQQYSIHIKLCVYLGREPEDEFRGFYDFIMGLWEDMDFSVDNEQVIIFHKGTNFYMGLDFKDGQLWCQYERVWSFFRYKKCMEYTETQDFVRSMVEQYLKCKVSTPIGKFSEDTLKVEQYLKCKVLTPRCSWRYTIHPGGTIP